MDDPGQHVLMIQIHSERQPRDPVKEAKVEDINSTLKAKPCTRAKEYRQYAEVEDLFLHRMEPNEAADCHGD
jgi:hypothetical protein